MNQNKILTLAEIEALEDTIEPIHSRFTSPNYDEYTRLLATARAYHELKNAEDTVEKLAMAHMAATPIDEFNRIYLDKPHAPTIKAIVEAFESVIRETALEKVDAGDIKLVLHRLRSILKEL